MERVVIYFTSSKKIIKEATFEDFAQWFGAFLFSCSLNMNYSSCYDHPNISTDEFCDVKQYNAIWNRIDKFGKGNSNIKRAWEQFQRAYNVTMTENFMPGRKDMRLQICCDDDKLEFAYSSLRDIPVDEESGISRQHHVKVNKKYIKCIWTLKVDI